MQSTTLMRFLISLFSINIFSAIGLIAAPEPPPIRELRVLAWSPLPIPINFGAGEKSKSVQVSTSRFTIVFPTPDATTVDFSGTITDPERGPRIIPYASAPWPADQRRMIGLLIPNGTIDAPRGLLVLLPDTEGVHTEHSMRFLNLTPLSLALRAGEITGALEPRGELVIPFNPTEGRLRVDLAMGKNQTWTRVLGTNLPTGPNHRIFAIIRPPRNLEPGTETDSPDISLVMDRTSKPPAATELLPTVDPIGDQPTK